MKTLKSLSTNLAVTLLLFSSYGSFSQSFQNTFLPTSEDNYVAGSAVNNYYYVLGNTTNSVAGTTSGKILLSVYNSVGASSFDNIYYQSNRPGILHAGTDIQAGYATRIPSISISLSSPSCNAYMCYGSGVPIVDIADPDSRKYFYATGYYKKNKVDYRHLLIFKLNTSGSVLWCRTGVIPPNNDVDEMGVSVESCPNRDVFAVSQTTEAASGLIYPTISRLDSNGTLIWRYDYKPGIDEPPYNFIPRQSCIFRESPQGASNDPIGIAVVGEMTLPGAVGSTVAVMRVGFDGTMRWKYNYFIYPTSPPFQAGWDIITEDNSLGENIITSENFVLTGLVGAASTPAPGTDCIVMRVNAVSGGFVNGNFISLVSPGHRIYGQSIYQALSPRSNVVIAGGVFDDEHSILDDTYLTKVDPSTGAIAWMAHYPLTTPNFPRTESVVSVGNKYPTAGYFLSTNAFDTYSSGTNTDAHVIKTDVSGSVNAPACLNGKIQPAVREFYSQYIQHCSQLPCQPLTKKTLNKVPITALHEFCYSVKRLEETDTDYESVFSIHLYPNPASSELYLDVFAVTDAKAQVEIISLDGKRMLQEEITLQEGMNTHLLQTQSLPPGVYFIRLVSPDGMVISRFVKSK